MRGQDKQLASPKPPRNEDNSVHDGRTLIMLNNNLMVTHRVCLLKGLSLQGGSCIRLFAFKCLLPLIGCVD